MAKYLFIDGNNLGCRAAFGFKDLSVNFLDYSKDYNPDDVLKPDSCFPTGALHGFFKSILSLKYHFPGRYICVVWDGRSKARISESKSAVTAGIVPHLYKENRVDKPEQVVNFHRQRPVLMEALSMTNIPQVMKDDEEADDVIASFVTKLKGEDILVATNDHDYYQLLGGTSIINASSTVLDEQWFRSTYNLSPGQWIDVGGLCGDDGDFIFGIPWWGEITAVKEIVKHSSCEGVLDAYRAAYGHLLEKFPDLKGDDFALLKSLKTNDGKSKYPDVKPWMPFTGVAWAYETGKVKIPRNCLMALVYQSRVPLAKKLKAMRTGIPLPRLPSDLNRDRLNEFVELCCKYQLNEISSSARKICERQTIK